MRRRSACLVLVFLVSVFLASCCGGFCFRYPISVGDPPGKVYLKYGNGGKWGEQEVLLNNATTNDLVVVVKCRVTRDHRLYPLRKNTRTTKFVVFSKPDSVESLFLNVRSYDSSVDVSFSCRIASCKNLSQGKQKPVYHQPSERLW